MEKEIEIPAVNREVYTAMFRINEIRNELVAFSRTPEGDLIDQTDALDNVCTAVDSAIGHLGDLIGMFAAEAAILTEKNEKYFSPPTR